MSLLRALTNLGVQPSDATTIDNNYANQNESDFLDGLEIVAKSIALKQLQTIIPVGEPWAAIYQKMLANGNPELGFFDSLACFDAALQISLSQVILTRCTEITQYQNKLNQSTGKRKKSGDYLKILHHLGYKFRFNMCTQSIEVNNQRINDEIAQQIRKQVRDAGAWEVNAVEDVYGSEAYDNRYHPIRDYLSALKFDGGDPISDLSTYFIDEYGVFSTWLRRWLIGAVARAHGGHQNRMMILDGIQGLGKSEFVKFLGSPLPEYSYEGAIAPENKDCKLRLLNVWIWEVNEFGSTSRRADREQLKAFLSTEIVTERRPYGKYDIQGTALTSFIGTVNNEQGILSDPTGSRRFMTTRLKSIDWDYRNKIDVDQVWAQAYDLYLHDEPWNLSPTERQQADEINEKYQVIDIVEETVQKFFEITHNNQDWLSTLEILNTLKDPYQGNLKPGSELDTRRLAATLTKLGLDKPMSRKIGGKVVRGYYGIK